MPTVSSPPHEHGRPPGAAVMWPNSPDSPYAVRCSEPGVVVHQGRSLELFAQQRGQVGGGQVGGGVRGAGPGFRIADRTDHAHPDGVQRAQPQGALGQRPDQALGQGDRLLPGQPRLM
ncbi:hypothetical protein [Streptomyces sp. NPDC021212]|uniref:hypothetical protein n=1 Tax=Streptomyces sp. NPDC021212 TaxID=3365118 RepID=UPI00379F4881